MKNLTYIMAVALASTSLGVPLMAQTPAMPCVVVSVKDPNSKNSMSRPQFSATRVLDLVVSAHLTSLVKTAPVLMDVKFLTPKGNVYQTRKLPVAPEGKPGREVAVPGYPYPVAERVLKAPDANVTGKPWAQVEDILPVAGTDIVKNSLYGKWQVEVSFPMEKTECRGTAEFTVVQ